MANLCWPARVIITQICKLMLCIIIRLSDQGQALHEEIITENVLAIQLLSQ